MVVNPFQRIAKNTRVHRLWDTPRQRTFLKILDIKPGQTSSDGSDPKELLSVDHPCHLKNRNAPKYILLVFSVTPFKIDQNYNQNRLIDKVQNKGNERWYIYKDPRQDSGQRNISYTRYPKKCSTQIYRDLYGDAVLVLTWMSSNMADGNQQKHLLPSFATKA